MTNLTDKQSWKSLWNAMHFIMAFLSSSLSLLFSVGNKLAKNIQSVNENSVKLLFIDHDWYRSEEGSRSEIKTFYMLIVNYCLHFSEERVQVHKLWLVSIVWKMLELSYKFFRIKECSVIVVDLSTYQTFQSGDLNGYGSELYRKNRNTTNQSYD